mgnify:FL=1|jgi:hypothetical protein|tara:strand:- start:12 stop:299 length:288 start_codon:yes stop_codon:yes gene_type:complete
MTDRNYVTDRTYEYIDNELIFDPTLIPDAVSHWMTDWTIDALKSNLPLDTKFNKDWSRETLEDIVHESIVDYFSNKARDQELEMLFDGYSGLANY